MDVKEIGLAGFDGYREASVPNYINPNMEYDYSADLANKINEDVVTGINKLNIREKLAFVTSSLYEVSENR